MAHADPWKPGHRSNKGGESLEPGEEEAPSPCRVPPALSTDKPDIVHVRQEECLKGPAPGFTRQGREG